MKVLDDRAGHPYTDLGHALAYLTPCCHAHATIDEHGVLYCRACFHEAPSRCAAGPTSADLHPPRR
ncbi:MAG: hypothetical protein ACRDT2_08815 [Natronosporangium sp.]